MKTLLIILGIVGMVVVVLIMPDQAQATEYYRGMAYCTDAHGRFVVDAEGYYVFLDARGRYVIDRRNNMRVVFFTDAWRQWYEAQRSLQLRQYNYQTPRSYQVPAGRGY